jgi:small subunit ribosomal protein S2
MHYVNARWLGGMLTNFKTIRRESTGDLLHKMEEDGTFDFCRRRSYQARLEMEKLEKFLAASRI